MTETTTATAETAEAKRKESNRKQRLRAATWRNGKRHINLFLHDDEFEWLRKIANHEMRTGGAQVAHILREYRNAHK